VPLHEGAALYYAELGLVDPSPPPPGPAPERP
jgi:hypothetical protein